MLPSTETGIALLWRGGGVDTCGIFEPVVFCDDRELLDFRRKNLLTDSKERIEEEEETDAVEYLADDLAELRGELVYAEDVVADVAEVCPRSGLCKSADVGDEGLECCTDVGGCGINGALSERYDDDKPTKPLPFMCVWLDLCGFVITNGSNCALVDDADDDGGVPSDTAVDDDVV